MEMLRLPYAEYLCKNDKFEEALKVYRKINRIDISNRILLQMSQNSVEECRYKQSSNYFWYLAIEYQINKNVDKFNEFSMIADMYFAYDIIYKFNEEPYSQIKG